MRLPIQVGIYVIRENSVGDRQYLLLHRVLKRLFFWQPVTGGVESGESVEETAARELIEETGFAPDDLQNIGYTYSFPADEFFQEMYKTKPEEITQHVFVVRVPADSEPNLDPVEHDEHRWCLLEEAHELLYWWDDKESIMRVEAFLNQQQE